MNNPANRMQYRLFEKHQPLGQNPLNQNRGANQSANQRNPANRLSYKTSDKKKQLNTTKEYRSSIPDGYEPYLFITEKANGRWSVETVFVDEEMKKEGRRNGIVYGRDYKMGDKDTLTRFRNDMREKQLRARRMSRE